MAYCSRTQLGQLSAIPAEILAAISTTIQDANLEAGASKINGYLAGRYGDRLPITNPPPDIIQANADISAYLLMSRYGYLPEGADVEFRQRYEDVLDWLKDVSRGAATLDLGASPATASPYRAARVLSRCPRGW